MIKRLQTLTDELKFRIASAGWPDYSRLLLVADAGFWSVAWDMIELRRIANRLGIPVMLGTQGRRAARQSVFFGSHFELLLTPSYFETQNRLATAYFHGRPGTGVKEFDDCFESLRRNHERIGRIQVTHAEMRDLILSSGIDASKVFTIPIGINLDFFRVQTPDSRRSARVALGIPESAVVVGSFQKDGVGWGDGMEPKLIKGPDVFLSAVRALKARVPELFVLLSGPARGYVKAGLSQMGVPFCHHFVKNYPDVGGLFQALDLYIVSSRQEGGPKAILESMANGVPIVSTRVGQATDLIKHGENGWLCNVDDAEALVHCGLEALAGREAAARVTAARRTAELNSYESQIPLWQNFMSGFAEWKRI